MTFGIYRGIMPHDFESTNNNGVTPMKNEKKLDGCAQIGWGILGWSKFTALLFSLICIFGNSGCGGGGDDDTNCGVSCPDDPDAGMMADADPDAPDADTTPDGNTAGSCADYAGIPPDGWQCAVPNNPSYDVNGLTFIVEDGACRLRSDSFWCQDPPPATDVQAGQFSCTDINGAFITCWHN